MSLSLVEVLTSAEKRWQHLQEMDYARFAQHSWYTRVAKIRPSQSRTEVITWLLSTATLRKQGVEGGNMHFSGLAEMYTEYTSEFAGEALQLERSKFMDVYNSVQGGEGINAGAEWSGQIAMQSAYWPQKQVATFMKNGESLIGYDGKALFATDHPVHPKDASKGTFRNLLTDAAYTITTAKSADQNFEALQNIAAYIRKIRMPNGEDPRFLKVSSIIAGPNLAPKLNEVVNAKFLARYAGGGTSAAGSSDVAGVLSRAGFGEIIEADEFAGTNDDDASIYVVCEQAASSQLGALVYIDREPFTTRYYSGMGDSGAMDAILSRTNQLEWHCTGRNTVGAGHPFLIFKVRPA